MGYISALTYYLLLDTISADTARRAGPSAAADTCKFKRHLGWLDR